VYSIAYYRQVNVLEVDAKLRDALPIWQAAGLLPPSNFPQFHQAVAVLYFYRLFLISYHDTNKCSGITTGEDLGSVV